MLEERDLPVEPAMHGTFSATIAGDEEHSFQAQLNRSESYRRKGEAWFISGVQRVDASLTYAIRLDLPDDFDDDGKTRRYQIQKNPGEDTVTAIIWAQDVAAYIATSGSVEICLKQGKMTASFNLNAENQEKTLSIDDGKIDLQLGYGEFSAEFKDGLFKAFKGQTLDLYKTSDIVGNYKFYTRAQMIVEIPYARYIMSVVLRDGLAPDIYKLNPLEERALVIFIRNGSPVVAHSGTLTIESLPSTGYSKGSFDCTFKTADAQEFSAKGNFNIRDNVDV